MVDTVPSLVISLRYGGSSSNAMIQGMGMVGKILRMAHLQSILKNVILEEHKDAASNHSVWALSLDSESCHDNSPIWDVKKRTLEGFSFFSEDETDKITKATAHQTDQNMDVEEPSNGKIKRKAEKSSGVARKKGKTAGGKPCNV
ncbi:hypothetical protein D5086_027675 [Populus alba]|uniref:Uncharacterized protein n=1 Tax=Populus alba TaxID=43335 RepID=A0ACC4AWV5_POPAL